MRKIQYIMVLTLSLICTKKGFSQNISALKCTPVLYVDNEGTREKYLLEFEAIIDSVSEVKIGINDGSGTSNLETMIFTHIKVNQDHFLQGTNGTQSVVPPALKFYFETPGHTYRDKQITIVLIMKNGQHGPPSSVLIK